MKEEKMPVMPVFWIGTDFWKNFEPMMREMLKLKVIDEDEVNLIRITDNLEEVVAAANKIGHPKISENYYDGFKEASAIN